MTEDRSVPMMGCGHSANALDGDGKPVCVICADIHPEAATIVEAPPLEKRRARCAYFGTIPKSRNHSSNYGCRRGQVCDCEEPSRPELPFFAHQADVEFDQFYCGCHGWD